MYGEIKHSSRLREKNQELGTSRGGECQQDMQKVDAVKRERVKRQEESLNTGEESEFKGKSSREAHREAGDNKREEKKSERLCDSRAAEQQLTERRKSRFELIFVEEVNMIVQSTLLKPWGFCRAAAQVAERQCATWPSPQGPGKRSLLMHLVRREQHCN